MPHPHRSAPAARHYPRWLFWGFIVLVILSGLSATLLGFALRPELDPLALVALALLAGLTELFQVKVYGEHTISVSVSFAFAAALLCSLPGVALVSVAITLADYLRRRLAFYRHAFNWAVHVLAGSIPALVIVLLERRVPFEISSLHVLAVPITLAALAYYGLESGLVALAISLSQHTRIRAKWREQFSWMVLHYLVLCLLGLFLALTYSSRLGLVGLAVLVLPVLMMRYTQKLYVERTRDSVEELKRMNLQLSRANDEVLSANAAIHQLNDELFLTLAKIIDARDPYVGGHAATVAAYATALASELGLPAEQVGLIRQAGFLHDIGKIGISEQVLHKPGKLTEQEYEYIKRHVTIGAELIDTAHGLRDLLPAVRHHHERWDGSGYPDGLSGEQIPLAARILAICDAVDVMASDRPYHRPLTLAEIVAELGRCAGSQFDPQLTSLFLRILEREGEQMIVNSAEVVGRKYSARDEALSLEASSFEHSA